MTLERTEAAGRASGRQVTLRVKQSLWGFTPLPRLGSAVLVSAVSFALICDATVALMQDSPAVNSLFEAAAVMSVALFMWRPPLAASLLSVAGFAAHGLSIAGSYSLLLAVVAGLTVYTCSRLVSLTYFGASALWVVIALVDGDQIEVGGAIAVAAVGTLSGVIGFSFRRWRLKERALAADNVRLADEASRAITAERERIVDELHNIISHDLTVVLMHARALEFVDTSEGRQQSERAIASASAQALTDIRRMMRLVQHGSEQGESTLEPIREVVCSASKELHNAGIETRLDVPQSITPISNTINTALVHIVRECTTNILKHVPDAREAVLSIQNEGGRVRLRIENDRAPVTGKLIAESSGYGLERLRERVDFLGGNLSVDKSASRWIVDVALPHT